MSSAQRTDCTVRVFHSARRRVCVRRSLRDGGRGGPLSADGGWRSVHVCADRSDRFVFVKATREPVGRAIVALKRQAQLSPVAVLATGEYALADYFPTGSRVVR